MCFVWLLKLCHTQEAKLRWGPRDAGYVSSNPIGDEQWALFAKRLGRAMSRHRVDLGMTQEDLAYSAGISRYTYQKFEKGESRPDSPANPSLRNVMAIATVLDIPLESLITESLNSASS